MKITNFALINLLNRLDSFGDKKLPQKISYAITRNMVIISEEYKIYDSQLKKIFEKYSEYMLKDENGEIKRNGNGIPYVEDSVRQEFNEQIEDLLNIEIDIDLYYIDESVFDYDDSKGIYDVLPPKDILVLQSIICKKEDGE